MNTNPNQTTRETVFFNWMGHNQRQAVKAFLRGEERAYFGDVLGRLAATIDGMPHSGATDGQGDNAIVHLHFFTAGADWWITEKDAGSPDDPADERGKQHQAFGLADLFGDGGELGYISIPEITAEGAELDFHWTPKTIAQVRSENEFAFPPQVDTEVSKALVFVQGLQSKAL